MLLDSITRIFFLLTALCSLVLQPAQAAAVSNVLVIYANNRLLPANIEANRGIRDEIGKAPGHVDLFEEFLDSPTFTGPQYEKTVSAYLQEKYAARPPRAIIVAGKAALDFVLRHRDELFPGVPVVHLAIDATYLRSIEPMPTDVIGVPVDYDFGATIEQALRWHPNTRRLVVVTGSSARDRSWESQVRKEIAGLGVLASVEFLSALSTDEIKSRLHALGVGDVVFTPGYFMDGTGRAFSPQESAALMATSSSAPIYSPFSTFIGTGVVGGRMANYLEMGREAGRAVNGLLEGIPPAELHLPQSMPSVIQVDWQQARKWGVSEDDIPQEAIVHFKQPTFWEAYQNKALLAFGVMLLQAALIGALLIERRRRRVTAAALAESEKHMGLAARASRLTMWIWDLGQDRTRGAASGRQNGRRAQETPIHFDQVLETIHPADRRALDQAVRQSVMKDEELDVEYRIVRPDGEVQWIAARGRPDGDEPSLVIGVTLDITARKAAEFQAEKDRAALTHMTRVSMLGQLSAAIAHQLNQPLAAILGNAEAAQKMLERGDANLAELKEICDDIIAEDQRAAEVIRRLGALFKRGEMQLAPMQLNELVSETLDLVRSELMMRHVSTLAELAPLPPVDGSRVQLQQVLLNLILNAADAMNAVDPARRTLKVRTELLGPDVRLCVIDHGTGIAPNDLHRVFDAFWSTKAGGTGMGLAICQAIITAHRGKLTATNNPEGGASFCVSWPIRKHH